MAARHLSADTRRAVRRYGPSVQGIAGRYHISGAALLAKLIAGESGDDPDAVSPANARGRAQFIPSSRKIAVQRYGVDPWGSADEAVHAAALHLRGKINGSKGLEGYNPGDPSYPGYILGQKVGNVHGSKRMSVERPTPQGAVLAAAIRQPGQSPLAVPAFSAGPTLAGHPLPANPAPARPEVPAPTDLTTTVGPAMPKTPRSPRGSFAGTTALLTPYSKRAHSLGLKTTSAKRSRRTTSTGNVSDHYVGNRHANARDWSGDTATMDHLAREIASDLGVHDYTGGPLTVSRGGYRYQLLYRTDVGGNHWDHIHLGIRKTGK